MIETVEEEEVTSPRPAKRIADGGNAVRQGNGEWSSEGERNAALLPMRAGEGAPLKKGRCMFVQKRGHAYVPSRVVPQVIKSCPSNRWGRIFLYFEGGKQNANDKTMADAENGKK